MYRWENWGRERLSKLQKVQWRSMDLNLQILILEPKLLTTSLMLPVWCVYILISSTWNQDENSILSSDTDLKLDLVLYIWDWRDVSWDRYFNEVVKGFEHNGEKDAMKGRIVILANDIQRGIFQCVSLWDSCIFYFCSYWFVISNMCIYLHPSVPLIILKSLRL